MTPSDAQSSGLLTAGGSFWSQSTVESRLYEIVGTDNPPSVKQGAIELRMGCEAYVTGETGQVNLKESTDKVIIPPGQLALLLTEERVSIPLDSIGLISIKFGWKARGLLNVSGFHVDSGFSGWLTYSVYNAGPAPVIIRKGDRVFLLWLSKLDTPTLEADGYSPINNSGRGQTPQLDDQLIMNIQGKIASPNVLGERIEKLREEFERVQLNQKFILAIGTALLFAVIGWIITRWNQPAPLSPPATPATQISPPAQIVPAPAILF